MRMLTSHQINGANAKITIKVVEVLIGAGGAPTTYDIEWRNDPRNYWGGLAIKFQDGTLKESGVNGLTHEVLLAILIDRLECFQRGSFACVENARALGALKMAAESLHSRTKRRTLEGTEGTHEPDRTGPGPAEDELAGG
jgi:hypothetical protein